MKIVDMSSDAITRRLRQTEQLRVLSISLMKAKPLSQSEAVEMRKRLREEKLASGKSGIEESRR